MINDQKCFLRSEDNRTWKAIEFNDAKRKLALAYKDVNLVMRAMIENGQTVRTNFAFYKFDVEPR